MSPPRVELITAPKILRSSTTKDPLNLKWPLTLKNDINVETEIILDYGICQGGLPVFDVQSASAPQGQKEVEFRVTYSETIEGIHHGNGDGPFFLFSNAMDSYRVKRYTVPRDGIPQIIKARHIQGSQRYQKLTLLTPNSILVFSKVGFQSLRPQTIPKASFRCSDPLLNKIWNTGVRTVDMCTVTKGETLPAWDITGEGTRVYGGHWAPCRQGTRWGDKSVRFEVRIESGGASWGVHMVANGLIFCLDARRRLLTAHEGLSDKSTILPSLERGCWKIAPEVDLGGWIAVDLVASGDTVTVTIRDRDIATVQGLSISPMLGGSGPNSGSVPFGGPEGWIALYRRLLVTDLHGSILYRNDLTEDEAERIFADFQVGANQLPCTIDGAKRDRACFGGDAFVLGRSIAYSMGDVSAWRGSLELLISHQTADGYLGNLCPIQAPRHDGDGEAPTYAFYSLGYALMTIVSVKDYWQHSGDLDFVRQSLQRLRKQILLAGKFVDKDGLVKAPPPLSMTWFPMGGPIFGASASINIAYYDALNAMAQMTEDEEERGGYIAAARKLKEAISHVLWDQDNHLMRSSTSAPRGGRDQHVHAYATTMGLMPDVQRSIEHLEPGENSLPVAFQGLGHWDKSGVVSPYATGFALEALFAKGQGPTALNLLRKVWGVMAEEGSPNYSGAHWEAMKADGTPFNHDVSLVHGWSTWPVFLMPRYLAGLRPLEPGWKKIAIEPVFTDLNLVDYSLETPQGLVEIRLELDEAAGKCELDLKLPKGVVASVGSSILWILDGPRELVGNGDEMSVTYLKASNA